jgi:hypothetical protein
MIRASLLTVLAIACGRSSKVPLRLRKRAAAHSSIMGLIKPMSGILLQAVSKAVVVT